MPRPKGSFKLTPDYCLHKASGRAYVTLAGKVVYLGEHNAPDSRARYERVVGEWLAQGRIAPPPVPVAGDGAAPGGVSIIEVVDAFWTHAQGYYRNPDGGPAREVDNFRLALRPLKRLYGPTTAATFKPKCLKAIRGEMVKPHVVKGKDGKEKTLPGWSRTYANRQIARLKQVFKWAAENELIPAAVYHAIATVAGLRKNRSDARETEEVRPVPDADVDAVLALPLVAPQLKAMVRLQRATGMRSSEVCQMTTGAIDTTGRLWVYVPREHKTSHHGHEREIYLNAAAQAVVKPFLRPNLGEYLFSPREAEAWRLAKLRENRKTPVQPCQQERAQRSHRRLRRRPPGERYTRESYRKAVARACRKADVPSWHPHQLRHSFATMMRKRHGIETARILLGHKSPAMTLVYAEADRDRAMQAVAEVG